MAKKKPSPERTFAGEAVFAGRTFDVLPDRIDLRDRPYTPPLVSLPSHYPAPSVIEALLPKYRKTVNDQESEGACTGFGLAAVVNFLLWTRYWRQRALIAVEDSESLQEFVARVEEPTVSVSPRMLYQMARHYDEWDGEDYEGSSCRGAMKGWQKHGVCLSDTWPYIAGRFVPPQDHWRTEAVEIPLGAYYRVDHQSINDLQSAIFEIGALYVSADVHDGWEIKNRPTLAEAVIGTAQKAQRGGHAFALVGFNRDGFIVQNSWGPEWGFHGFAILPYDDWLHHAHDAWAAALGVPFESKLQTEAGIRGSEGERTRMRLVAQDRRAAAAGAPAVVEDTDTAPWNDIRAYDFTVVQGDDGRPLNPQLTAPNAAAAVRHTCLDAPRVFFDSAGTPRILFYVHGGLNDQPGSLKRARVMGPYFTANQIYPVFYTWRTGFLESTLRLIDGKVEEWTAAFRASRTAQFDFTDLAEQLRRAKEWMADRWDAAIEAGCRSTVRPIWSEMKQTAADGTGAGGALRQVVNHWKSLADEFPELQIHLVGHSAGAMLLGELLPLMKKAGLPAASCTLWAPACSLDFALERYAAAVKDKTLSVDSFHIDVLSEELEREDSVGPYRKSLLYLISRSLERVRRIPILGLETAWTVPAPRTVAPWPEEGIESIKAWKAFWGRRKGPRVLREGAYFDGVRHLKSVHGSFDNHLGVFEQLLTDILGSKPKRRVVNLSGF